MKFYKDFELKELAAEVNFLEDLPDGKYYYNDYGKRCIFIKNGKKQGLEIFYGKKGTKIVEKYYNNGIRFYEIHFQRKKEKKLEQIKQLERLLKELKECVEQAINKITPEIAKEVMDELKKTYNIDEETGTITKSMTD